MDTTESDRVAGAARQFYDHQIARRRCALPEALRPRDLAEGYAVQDRLHALYAEGGFGALAGWKIALTTRVMQELVGVDHPCEGAIFSTGVRRGRATVPARDHVRIGGEAEIAVRLGRDLPAAGAPYDRDAVAGAVAACMAAVEIVDDGDVDYDRFDAPFLVAANGFNRGCVLGPEVTGWRRLDLAALRGRMTVGDELVGEGSGADVLGHPLEALAWLANSLVGRGRMLRAGEVVLTGSVVATRWLDPGETLTVVIEGLGEARLEIV